MENPRPIPASSNSGFLDAYEAAAPAVYAWVSLHLAGALRRELDAEDILQEVACRAFARRESFDSDRAPFRAWLFGIARNVLYRSLERLAAGAIRPAHDWLTTGGLFRVPDDATSITKRVAHNDDMAQFLAHIEALDEDERLLVRYRGLEGLEHKEVGRILGIEPKTAAKRWERLLTQLRGHTTFLA